MAGKYLRSSLRCLRREGGRPPAAGSLPCHLQQCELLGGLPTPPHGAPAASDNLHTRTPSAVFLISGMMLKTDDIKKALRHKWGVLFGFISTLAITPCLGFAMREIHLTPEVRRERSASGSSGMQGWLLARRRVRAPSGCGTMCAPSPVPPLLQHCSQPR